MRTVAILAGGTSSEHEVSRWSGERVLESLDRRRYRPLFVLIEKDGNWIVDGIRRRGALGGIEALHAARCDVAFVALHGPFGEDGTLQGFLDTVGLPYTGSGVKGSALAMDKIRTKQLVRGAGVEVAPDAIVPPSDAAWIETTLGFPVFVKNPYGGSSLEVRRAGDADGLARAIRDLSPHCDRLLVEAAVQGRELTVAVLDDLSGSPEPLPVVEIRSKGGFFDFENKYTAGVAEEIVPAPVDAAVARRVQSAALAVHGLLDLKGMSRSDFILAEDGRPVFLEVNTIPGLTPNSLLPKAAAAAGVTFEGVLTRLVESALFVRKGATMERTWNASSARSGGRSTGSSTAPTAGRSSS
jgi:D-alanine-D-alanine ligase